MTAYRAIIMVPREVRLDDIDLEMAEIEFDRWVDHLSQEFQTQYVTDEGFVQVVPANLLLIEEVHDGKKDDGIEPGLPRVFHIPVDGEEQTAGGEGLAVEGDPGPGDDPDLVG